MFRLSGTHELHTKWLRREASRPRVRGGVLCFDRAVRTNCTRSGYDVRPPVLRGECEEVFVFELSSTINTAYYTNNTTYQVATT